VDLDLNQISSANLDGNSTLLYTNQQRFTCGRRSGTQEGCDGQSGEARGGRHVMAMESCSPGEFDQLTPIARISTQSAWPASTRWA